jgi:hypothetical protein
LFISARQIKRILNVVFTHFAERSISYEAAEPGYPPDISDVVTFTEIEIAATDLKCDIHKISNKKP